MNIAVPAEFKTIKNELFEIEDGKIYNIFHPLLLILLEIFFAALFSISIVMLSHYDWEAGRLLSAKQNDPSVFFAIILFFLQLIFYFRFIYFNNVVDFSDVSVYKEFLFFGLRFRFYYYPKDQILQVGNNIEGEVINPGGKSGMINGKRVTLNPETNLFDFYQVSFLMKNGKTINFEFGYFDEEYCQTLRFVSIISNYWNIPTVRCNKNYNLVVCKSSNNSYELVEEKILYCYAFKKAIYVIMLCAILIVLVFFIMGLSVR